MFVEENKSYVLINGYSFQDTLHFEVNKCIDFLG